MYYTTYRPQKFSEISKPNDVAFALLNQLKAKKTSHAYLFVGPRGTGKTTTARILAKSLNCTNLEEDGDPCLECANCKAIKTGNFVDLIEIDAASNRGIDDIRDLKDRIKLAPSKGSTKVYIIDEVHMLTSEAFNALLKTLEEPPKNTVFVLCTTELHKVPDTIKSRCQTFKFKRATKAQLVEKLEMICLREGVTSLKRSDLEKIADASFGAFRDAETLLQQVIDGSLDAESFVGMSNASEYAAFYENIVNEDAKAALAILSKIETAGLNVNVWALGFLTYLRDLLYIKSGVSSDLLDVSDSVLAKMTLQVDEVPITKLIVILEQFAKATLEINTCVIHILPLELCVARLCTSSDDIGTNHKAPTSPKKPFVADAKNTDKSTSKNMKKTSEVDLGATFDTEAVLDDVQDLSHMFDDELDADVSDDNSQVTDETPENSSIDINLVLEKWSLIVKDAVTFNNSIHALLKACTPKEIEGGRLIIEVAFKFHKERLESSKNRKIVEGILEKFVGEPLTIACVINETAESKRKSDKEVGDLTDYNISAPAMFGQGDSTNLLDVFDGGLPL